MSGHHGGLHVCGGLDHHDGHYTPRQRADLDLVLAFNREASDVIDEGRDVLETLRFLDPDPLRYMWVDEGQGRIGEVVGRARGILARAPVLQGHRRGIVREVVGSAGAACPSVSASADGVRLTAWVEWVPGRGDVVRAALDLPGAGPGEAAVLSGDVADVFRPTALIATDGVPWVFWGQSADGGGGRPRGGPTAAGPADAADGAASEARVSRRGSPRVAPVVTLRYEQRRRRPRDRPSRHVRDGAQPRAAADVAGRRLG